MPCAANASPDTRAEAGPVQRQPGGEQSELQLGTGFRPFPSHPREALGIAGATRGELLEHALGIARRFWAGEAVDHNSGHFSASGLRLPIGPVQDPLEVWLGGRGPRALERAGRIADGWLGAQLTPVEAVRAREQIQLAAAHVGWEVDREHFGMSIAYARTEPDPDLLRTFQERRPDIDPRELIPVGADALQSLLEQYINAGLSKFVIRPDTSRLVDRRGRMAGRRDPRAPDVATAKASR